jgi:isocitrate lyase
LNCFEIMRAISRPGSRGPFRGPARLGKEVRPSRRQGADPDPGGDPQPRRGPPGGRRQRRPDRPGRAPDAESAKLITSDVDERDRIFLTGERTARRFLPAEDGTGLDHCIARGLAFAPHAGPLMVGDEPSQPRTRRGSSPRRCTSNIRASCSLTIARPASIWKAKLDEATIAKFQRELGRDGLQVPVRYLGRLP